MSSKTQVNVSGRMVSTLTGKPISKKISDRTVNQLYAASSRATKVDIREESMTGIDIIANEAFRQRVKPKLLQETIQVTKKLYNFHTIPLRSFRNTAYAINVKDLVLVCTFGMSFWQDHPNPNGLRNHIASLLEKESFVKKFTIQMKDTTYGRWEGERSLVIGFKVSKKKFKRWFHQNENRFLQHNNLHK